MLIRVLTASNDARLNRRLRPLLDSDDLIIYSVRNRRALWRELANESYDLLVLDRELLDASSADVIHSARNMPDEAEVIVVSARSDVEDSARMTAEGCIAVLDASLSDTLLGEAVHALIERRRSRLAERLGQPRSGRRVEPRLENFVTQSPSMQGFVRTVARVAKSAATLLITGETGVGKEWLARAIHAESPRSSEAFVAVNCGALAESLLESELFGHEEGAFTGATRSRRGMFEVAHGGTVFLDEIGEMPLHIQVKLLRVLQSREVQRVGAEKVMPIDVRIMAATNRDLDEDVASGVFRRDLFFRLSVVNLEVPPLRARPEDIPELAESYVDHFRGQFPQGVEGFSAEAIDALVAYEWPGNIRELMNVIERAMLLCDHEEIQVADLPAGMAGRGGRVRATPVGAAGVDERLPDGWTERTLREVREAVVEQVERTYLSHHLAATHGKVGITARRAGLDARSLYDKMRKLGLRKEDFKLQ